MIALTLSAILPIVGKIVDKLFRDQESANREKIPIEHELLKQLQWVVLAQIGVNKAEAVGNMLQRSWRLTFGWV